MAEQAADRDEESGQANLQTPLQRFESLAKRLLAIPKHEVDEQKAAYGQRRKNRSQAEEDRPEPESES